MKRLLFLDHAAFAELQRYIQHFEIRVGADMATVEAVKMLGVDVPAGTTEIEVIVAGGTARPTLHAA
jgi:hypothetical protein